MGFCPCMKWICYDDPTKKQCGQIVQKNGKSTQCKRVGKHYWAELDIYVCDTHFTEEVKKAYEKSMNDRRMSITNLFTGGSRRNSRATSIVSQSISENLPTFKRKERSRASLEFELDLDTSSEGDT